MSFPCGTLRGVFERSAQETDKNQDRSDHFASQSRGERALSTTKPGRRASGGSFRAEVFNLFNHPNLNTTSREPSILSLRVQFQAQKRTIRSGGAPG
jgi:hypothetical protein